MVEWLRFSLYFSFVWHVSLGFHLSRSFYPELNLIFCSKNRHIKPKSVNVVRLIFITSITCYFYLHTYAQRVGKKNTYKYICDFGRLRALFQQPFKYRRKQPHQHSQRCIIKWYADKLQPTHILSIFDTPYSYACVRSINPFDLFRLTFLTMVSLVCARCNACAMCTNHLKSIGSHCIWVLVSVSRCHVHSNHGNAL